MGAFTARQRSSASSMSLNAIAKPAARLPGPRVILVRCNKTATISNGERPTVTRGGRSDQAQTWFS